MKIPMAHQIETINAGKVKNLLIADKPGSGKTLMAIEIARHMMSKNAMPTVIICRTVAIEQWKAEIEDQETSWPIIVLSNKQPQERLDRPCWLLLNIEKVHLLPYQLFACLVIDEAHKIKNPYAARTKAVKKLQAVRKIALTGTPTERSSAADLWSILNWLYPDRFRRFQHFADLYAKKEIMYTRNAQQIKYLPGSSDPAGLWELIKDFTFQREKEHVRSDMPAKIELMITIDMQDDQKQLYDEVSACKDIVGPAGIMLLNEMSKQSALQRIASVAGYDQALHNSAKLRWIRHGINDIWPDQRIVIFVRYVESAALLAQVLEAPAIYGDTSATPEQIAQARVLVCSIDKCSESISLGDYDMLICAEPHYSSIAMRQMIDRIHRINITQAKTIYYLCLNNSIDEDMYTLVREKIASNTSFNA